MVASDDDLIKEAQEGSERAFTLLLERYYSLIYRTAYKWIGSKADAEEISQETCIKLGQHIQSFQRKAKFSSWVYAIVVNLCKDKLRTSKPCDPLGEHHLTENPDQNPEELYKAFGLWKQVQALPESQRDAILLVYCEGLTHLEASEILECAEGTVSWYISEAKKILSRRLRDDER